MKKVRFLLFIDTFCLLGDALALLVLLGDVRDGKACFRETD